MSGHINVNQEAGKQFYLDFKDSGKVVMLNLLKFRAIANYEDHPALKPPSDISGKEAYKLYMQYTLPILIEAGSKVLFYGKSKHLLIGPESEKWDTVILVEHQSAQAFIEFAQNESYLKTQGHRSAALEDSRLLPIHSRSDDK